MERSAGAIIFHKGKKTGSIAYLLLHYPSLDKKGAGHWDFPKGHQEEGETQIETAAREIREETGMHSLCFYPQFKEKIRYFFQKDGQKVFKEVVFFLVNAPSKDVQLSKEHIGFAWLPFKKAMKKGTFKNARDILEKANTFLETNQTLF